MTAAPPCVIPGCTNPGIDISNKWRTVPVLCKPCRDHQNDNYFRPRRCDHCHRRRQCEIDFNGRLQCRTCHSDHAQAEIETERSRHSHALSHARMTFNTDGSPKTAVATTICTWTAEATLEMVDGRAVYVLNKQPPQPLHYDPAAASCPRCRRG